MKIRKRSVVFAVLILVIFTILPLYAPSMMPQEYLRAFSSQGFDLVGLLSKVAFIGLVMSGSRKDGKSRLNSHLI